MGHGSGQFRPAVLAASPPSSWCTCSLLAGRAVWAAGTALALCKQRSVTTKRAVCCQHHSSEIQNPAPYQLLGRQQTLSQLKPGQPHAPPSVLLPPPQKHPGVHVLQNPASDNNEVCAVTFQRVEPFRDAPLPAGVERRQVGVGRVLQYTEAFFAEKFSLLHMATNHPWAIFCDSRQAWREVSG